MIDFLFSFALFWAGALLLLGYAVILYAVGAAMHYIAEHDETEKMFTTYAEVDVGARMYLNLPRFAVQTFGLLLLYIWLFHKQLTNMTDVAISMEMVMTCSFFLVLGVHVFFIDIKPDYPDFSSYFLNKKFGCALLALAALSFTVYIGEASQWLRKENSYRKAKLYIVAGQPLHYCKWGITGIFHPEIFFVKPITALQRVMLKRASRLIPEDDAEAAAWENRWFHSHYTRNLRVTLGDNFFAPMTEKEHPGSRFLISRWWHCLEEMGSKSFRDERVKQEIYLHDYARLAFVFYYLIDPYPDDEKLKIYAPLFSDEKLYEPLLPQPEFFPDKLKSPIHMYKVHLSRWLGNLIISWSDTEESRQFISRHPEDRAFAAIILAKILRDILWKSIYEKTFSCSSPTVEIYVEILTALISPKDGSRPLTKRVRKKAMRRTEDIDSAEFLYGKALEAAASLPGYAIERYCGRTVPGRAAAICLRDQPWETLKLTDKACAEKARQVDEAIEAENGQDRQILDEIFQGGPGEGPAQPAPPEQPAAKLKTAGANPAGP